MHILPRTAAGFAVALFTGAMAARAVTLTFDELPFQPVDGLSYQGVTFGFEVGGGPSADASYNAGGPGMLTYVQDPVLEGDAAGLLSLTFAGPATKVSFGLALSAFAELDPAAIVSLFDENDVLILSTGLATSPLTGFTEGWFSYASGAAPVSRIELDFDEASASRFTLDNLSHNAVPEAETAVAGLGLLALAGLRLRRRRA